MADYHDGAALNAPDQTMMAQMDLGLDASEFKKSNLGRYIYGCIQQEIAMAQQDLTEVSPWRRRKIRDLQFEIKKWRWFAEQIEELIASGKQAEQVLDQGS